MGNKTQSAHINAAAPEGHGLGKDKHIRYLTGRLMESCHLGSLLLNLLMDRKGQNPKGESFRHTNLLSTLIPTYTRAAPYFLPEAGRWYFGGKFSADRE